MGDHRSPKRVSVRSILLHAFPVNFALIPRVKMLKGIPNFGTFDHSFYLLSLFPVSTSHQDNGSLGPNF